MKRGTCWLSWALMAGVLGLGVGCGSDEATSGADLAESRASAYVENRFDPTVPLGIFQVAYGGAVFAASALANGQSSTPQPVLPRADYAYALAAFGWKTGDPTPADVLLIRTKNLVESSPGATVPIVFSLQGHVGKCGGTPPLTEAEYEEAVRTQFPGAKVQAYAAISCPGE